jgi:hypothetical protein
MRTTLTLEDDVNLALEQIAQEQGRSFKDVVNSVLRAGLTVVLGSRRQKRPRFSIEPVSLGTPRVPDLDNIAEVLALGEGEEHR